MQEKGEMGTGKRVGRSGEARVLAREASQPARGEAQRDLGWPGRALGSASART